MSFDHEDDTVLTYVLLYGIAGVLVGGVIALTVAIERRKKADPEPHSIPHAGRTGAPPEAPSSPTGRVGYKGRPGSIGKFRGTTFGERLDTDIDNEGDVDVEDSDLK